MSNREFSSQATERHRVNPALRPALKRHLQVIVVVADKRPFELRAQRDRSTPSGTVREVAVARLYCSMMSGISAVSSARGIDTSTKALSV